MNAGWKQALYHVLAWSAFFLVIGLSADRIDYDFLVKNLSSSLPVITVFYFNIFWVFPRFIPRKNYFMLVVSMLVVMATCVFIRQFVHSLFPDLRLSMDRIMFWVQFRLNLLFGVISLAYWYGKSHHKNERKWQNLQTEMADAQLKLLKNQINPHFLYNTLSLIYTKAIPVSAELADIISKLSDMLRYSLEEAETNGKVPLHKEVKYLEDFIAIHKARFGENWQVDFHIQGNPREQKIAPLLLITFVENAFKHGKLNAPLRIELQVENDGLRFEIENQKQEGKKDRSSGIGLENIRKRLAILYPHRHRLNIEDKANFFKVSLQLWDEN